MDDIIRLSDDDIDGGLADVSARRQRLDAEREAARDQLARAGTEALMAGRTLREVANATGYSISTVRRAKLLRTRNRPGWYPAMTRDGKEQRWDGERWVLEFRAAPRAEPDQPEPAGPPAGGITSEAQRRAAAGRPPPDYNKTSQQQQQLSTTTEKHTP